LVPIAAQNSFAKVDYWAVKPGEPTFAKLICERKIRKSRFEKLLLAFSLFLL
jgi:hypothetical protein